MRQLLPTYDEQVDLVDAYRYPPNRRWVRANMVSSVDGTAVVDGGSEGLSGPADKKIFGVLRGLCDVVLVGAGTARSENYSGLRAKPSYQQLRRELGQRPAPVLALASASLDLDPGSPLFRGDERTLVLTCEASDAGARVRLSEVADVLVAGGAEVDLAEAVDQLAARDLPRVLCEGGPSLLSKVSLAGRLDELCLTVAPLLVGSDGPRILDGPTLGGKTLTLAHVLEHDDVLFTRYTLG